MAKSDNKKSDEFQKVLERTLENISSDRSRISDFLDKLSEAVSPKGEEENPDRVVMAAQSYAKIADSLVKNNQLQINVAALLQRGSLGGDEVDPVTDKIGTLPFKKFDPEEQNEN